MAQSWLSRRASSFPLFNLYNNHEQSTRVAPLSPIVHRVTLNRKSVTQTTRVLFAVENVSNEACLP